MSINLIFVFIGISAFLSVAVANWAEKEGRFKYYPAFFIGLIFSPLVSLIVVAMQPRQLSPEAAKPRIVNAFGRGFFIDSELQKLCTAARVPMIGEYDSITEYVNACISVSEFCNGQSFMMGDNESEHCIVIPTSSTETIAAKPGEWVVVYGDGTAPTVFSTRILNKRLKTFTPSPVDNISTGMF